MTPMCEARWGHGSQSVRVCVLLCLPIYEARWDHGRLSDCVCVTNIVSDLRCCRTRSCTAGVRTSARGATRTLTRMSEGLYACAHGLVAVRPLVQL